VKKRREGRRRREPGHPSERDLKEEKKDRRVRVVTSLLAERSSGRKEGKEGDRAVSKERKSQEASN